ncbi:sialoadhesin-like isoform X2 [Colossoma macropomum]|uniref:sialoadhesin-like isoform X2 n=1 Tax=Colossoma macropomum TaxID=42526 RepID=UPI001864E68F|nr:sialoadhesin-like isoform X2 [Colossoma macropomum]
MFLNTVMHVQRECMRFKSVYHLSTERPKATVKVQPADHVFIRERVTLTCEIESGDYWNYEWYKNNNLLRDAQRKEYEISNVDQSHAGVYTCKGTQSTGRIYTHTSEAVTLTVSERPKATVKVQPADHVFIRERVTLTCEIESGDDWNYEWYKNNNLLRDAQRKEYEISNVDQSHAGVYTCKGTQSTGRIYTHTSEAVTLTVSVKVRPTITSNHDGPVLTGNTVTLYCNLPQSAGWTFYWSKHTQNSEKETITNVYTISSVSLSDGGQYWCRAGRGNPVYYTHHSAALWVNVTDSTKAMVSIKPDKQVFKGEAVTLRCDTQAGGDTRWTYSWYKDDRLSSNRRTQEFTISPVTESNGGKYTCRGERKHDSQSSEISDAVTLTVSDVAQAVLSVSPQSWLTEGDSVTLSCEVTGSSTGWTFSWYRAVLYRQGLQQIRDVHGNVLYHVELLSDSRRGAGGSYTLSPAALNHTGVYVCRAERGEPAYQTQYSTPQTLWITGSSPPASLIISPSRTQHFSAGSLSLSCEGQSDSTGWRVRRYTHSGEVSDCSSVTGSTCNISSLYTSLTGVYWCQSESGGGSDPLNITVHNGDVILDSPVHPVSEGDSLTLRCLCRSTKPSNLTADFYKDGSLLQTQTTGEMIIRTVSKSDEGLYHCKHPEKGESPKSWLSVRASGSGSDGVTVGVAVGLSLTLFLIIILGLICCYKKNKDDSAAQPSDVTYAEIETTNNYKGIYEPVRRPNDVTYYQIKMENLKHHREGL